jgi:hypothetical protein
MLKRLRLSGTIFYGLHTSNVVSIAGTLPEDQEKLIGLLEEGMTSIPAEILNSRPVKGHEGAAIIG